MITAYLKEIKKFDPLTREEELDLFTKAKNGDIAAKNKIINCNLRFVVQVAKDYQNQGLDLDELIQEGNLGLIRAYDKFDVNLGNKFITYAVWWIRQSISMAINEHGKAIRLPLNKVSNVNKIRKLKESTEQQESRIIYNSELEKLLDNPEVIKDLKYNYIILNLDKSQTDDNKNLNDIIADTTIDPYINLESLQDELKYILCDFTPKEQTILKMYFGLDNIRRYTLKEIGYELRLTRERIRQIKDKILEKLRKKRRSDKLRGYIT